MPGGALHQPLRLALEIIDLRAYARAKAAVDTAEREQDATPWQREVVFDVVAELWERAQAARAVEEGETDGDADGG